MKRLFRFVGLLLGSVLFVCSIIVLLFYLPPVQRLAMGWGSKLLENRMGFTFFVTDAHIRFPLRLQMSDAVMIAGKDTLLSFEELNARFQVYPLLKGEFMMDYLTLQGVTVRSGTLISGVGVDGDVGRIHLEDFCYNWNESVGRLRDVSVSDGMVKVELEPRLGDFKDNTHNHFPLHLSVDAVRFNELETHCHWPSFILDADAKFIALDGLQIDPSLSISLDRFLLSEGNVRDFSSIYLQANSICYNSSSLYAVFPEITFRGPYGLELQSGFLSLDVDSGLIRLPDFAFRTEASSVSGHLRMFDIRSGSPVVDADIDASVGYADMLRIAQSDSHLSEEFLLHYPQSPLIVDISVDGTLDRLHLNRADVSLTSAFDVRVTGDICHLEVPEKTMAQLQLSAMTYELDFLSTMLDTLWQQRLVIPYGLRYEGNINYAPDSLYSELAVLYESSTLQLSVGYGLDSRCYSLGLRTDTFNMRHFLPDEEVGVVTLQAMAAGKGFELMNPSTRIHCTLWLDSLEWGSYSIASAQLTAVLDCCQLSANIAYADTLLRAQLHSTLHYTPSYIGGRIYANVSDINLQGMGVTGVDLHPSFQCQIQFTGDTAGVYTLHSRFYEMAFAVPERVVRPQAVSLCVRMASDSLSLQVLAGDLHLSATTHTIGLPWQWKRPSMFSITDYRNYFRGLHIDIRAGNDNPISNYLALVGTKYRLLEVNVCEVKDGLSAYVALDSLSMKGITSDSVRATVILMDDVLHAEVYADDFLWKTSSMLLSGSVTGNFVWTDLFRLDDLTGSLSLSEVRFSLPSYSVQLHTADTLSVPFVQGDFILDHISLYAYGHQQLMLNGRVKLLSGGAPALHLTLDASEVDLLQHRQTPASQLFGTALVDGHLSLDGPFNALMLNGTLSLRTGSSLHYIYRNMQLTAGNRLDDVVTFTTFSTLDLPSPSPLRSYKVGGFTMNLNVSIDPTVSIEVMLGTSGENTGTLYGGGNLNIQFIPASGLRLSGKYTVVSGELLMNMPLFHVHSMSIRPGSTIQWSGNPLNPILDVAAEYRIRASVTIDDTPQTVLFVAGVSITDTLERLGLKFTLEAPENASMQNILATQSPDERSKLAVAMLTTGLYLGEGGSGNLMNTALLGFLQSQLDNISRDTFRSVDVSFGIEPLPDGVSGVSTRTDYSFSVAKRFWNDRIRIVIGGSVTTSNETIEENAIIDNVSIEWRLVSNGSQYVRFFYDKNFESILEGEIRETGVGYLYRRQLDKFRF